MAKEEIMEIKIRKIDEVFSELVTHFKKKTIVPIFGAGLTCGEKTSYGQVPSGVEYKEHMLRELNRANFSSSDKEKLDKLSFSNLCDIYEDDENVSIAVRREYLKSNFCNVSLNAEKIDLLNLDWPYLYTINIDDAIEKNSKFNRVILPKRDIQNSIFDEDSCVIKLHGDIGEILAYKDSNKVFTSKEYSISVFSNNVLLKKLQHDYQYLNIIFIGCSLDDEFDLKSADMLINNRPNNKTYSKVYYCTIYEPNAIVKSQLKTYGVTDVILFKNYSEIYEKLTLAGHEAKKINKSDLSDFQKIPVRQLKQKDYNNNRMFFFGLSIFNSNEKTLNFPYYFIERNLKNEFLNNLSKNILHFIFGNRISGKTYFLVNLYNLINDRDVYYFNSTVQLNDKAFDELILEKNIIALFDTNVLSREQFEKILSKSAIIHNNRSNFVVAINNNDSDLSGIIRWKLENGGIGINDFHKYYLKNVLDKEETKNINNLLPYCNLPVFKDTHSILDNLLSAEKLMNRSQSRFSTSNLKINSLKELVFYIALATKNKLFSTDIIKFESERFISDIVTRNTPFIECIEALNFEKDGSYSPLKYVLNARYWLFRELGKYATNKNNHATIVDAYKFIVRKQIASTGKTSLEIRKNCRDFIMFDTINQIFMNENNGQLLLSEKIYNGLHELLAQNHHYLHQYSKCCLRSSYVVREILMKKRYLLKGLKMAKVAASMIETEYEKSTNENLLITLAHVEYSIATMAGELCCLNNFKISSDVAFAINYSSKALYSPYNKDDYLRDKKQKDRGIFKFIDRLSGKAYLFDKEIKRQAESLLSYIINLK